VSNISDGPVTGEPCNLFPPSQPQTSSQQ